jgi:hypothetical protein
MMDQSELRSYWNGFPGDVQQALIRAVRLADAVPSESRHCSVSADLVRRLPAVWVGQVMIAAGSDPATLGPPYLVPEAAMFVRDRLGGSQH